MASVHDGHRQRMRERFLADGMEHMQPHEILELLLFYPINRRDTNELAHRLLKNFGSLAQVLEAPYEDLLAVPGVGAETATFLKMMVPTMKAYLNSGKKDALVMNTYEKCGNYLLDQYLGVTVEQMSILCMNRLYELKSFIWLGTGSSSSVECSAKAVVTAVTRQPCDMVILAHNHPSNLLLPSELDITVTKQVKYLLDTIGVHLVDHIIIGRNDYVSIASTKRFEKLFL